MRQLLVFIIGFASACSSLAPSVTAPNKLTFHVDAFRSGWNAAETVLTPGKVARQGFGLIWSSPELDAFEGIPPRLFATPLYMSAVRVAANTPNTLNVAARRDYAVVYAASSTGFVYAISAKRQHAAKPGEILWRKQLTDKPCTRGSLGILSTPVIDPVAQRIYVSYCDNQQLWSVTALDIRDGATVTGWPVLLDHRAVNAPGVNRNGGNQFPAIFAHLQRAALNLSPDRSRLYVAFGGEPTSGWMLSVDTVRARIASAFSATANTEEGVGGMWAAAGPAVDHNGHVYMSTGSSVINTLAGKGIAGVFPRSAGNWGQSLIELADSSTAGLSLVGTYTPFNYCQTGARDMDIGASGPVLIDLIGTSTATPHLLALGGAKQGNAYLLNRDHLPGSLTKRQACGDDSSRDGSLLAPEAQPQFGRPGPLNVFGPYTDTYGMGDQARSRSTLAYFRNAAGADYLFLTGSSKADESSAISIAPSLVRLKIVSAANRPAFLRIDRKHETMVLQNPGSPVVSSRGSRDAIVWILDINRPRSASLYGPDAPQPVLYAIDAESMGLLWQSAPGQLHASGKYNEATVVDGMVLVGTDRIQAFALGAQSSFPLAAAPKSPSPRSRSTPSPKAMPPTGSADGLDVEAGGLLYRLRCASCHDSAAAGVPTRQDISARPRGFVLEKILFGSMQTHSLGLTEAQIGAIAAFLVPPVP